MSELEDLQQSYQELAEELAFIHCELNDPVTLGDPGYRADLLNDEESVSAELERLSNKIAALVAERRRVAVGQR